MKLTKLGRRALAHLPDWAEDEAAHIEMEGGPEISIRSYTLPEFTQRLAEDPFTVVDTPPRPLTEAEVEVTLQGLVDVGLASVDADGNYRMEQLGFESLIAPEEAEGQVPGAVVIDIAPAVAESAMRGA